MAGLNEYLPFATGGGANVLGPVDYAALPARGSGFNNGIADPTECNTPWRQASVGTAAVAAFVLDQTPAVDMLDDGSVNNFKTKFTNALNFVISNAIDASGSFGSGGLFGLTMSNSVANPTTRITVSIGQCRDSTNTKNINLVGAITKRLDAAWAAGDNNGGRDAGALANGQTWHMFVILNPTTLVVDALFSTSPTAPTLPAGFTKFRRIGAVVLEAASTLIRLFKQVGDYFSYQIRSVDYAAQANGGGPFLRAIAVPVGIVVEATFYFQSTGATTGPFLSGLYDPAFGAPPAFGGATQWAQVRRLSVTDAAGGFYSYGTVMARQFTDNTGKIYTFSSDAVDVLALGVIGWRDERGRFY